MVTFKVDTEAVAKIQGSEDQEKYPVVAKVKGTGKDGGISVQVSGEGSSPISARISGDAGNPVAVAPISIDPISVVPDIKQAAEFLNIPAMISALTKITESIKTEGVKVDVSNSGAPLSIALGKIPIDLTISVYSPAQETVFKVEIKGSVGEK